MDQYDRLGNNVDLANADEYDLYDDEDPTCQIRLPEDEPGFDPYREAMDHEYDTSGDPRRCPHHPSEITSSPDGMFDAPCGYCENAGLYPEEDTLVFTCPTLDPPPSVVDPVADTIPSPPSEDHIPF